MIFGGLILAMISHDFHHILRSKLLSLIKIQLDVITQRNEYQQAG